MTTPRTRPPERLALVVDDDESIRWVLGKALERCGVRVRYATTVAEARAALAAAAPPLVFLDVRLPDGDGLELLRALSVAREAEGTRMPRVIIITAQDAMSAALEAMKLGAYDFLAKPFDVAQVVALVDTAFVGVGEDGLPAEGARPVAAAGLVGQSRRMLEVVKAIGRVAPTDATVLLTGESGTGKEVVARAIHTHSARARGPFVTVNTAAIPRELLESELYGHERGAFTGATERRVGRFEQASSGTLFLDEIGDMPIDQQVKLLRVLQESRIDRVGGGSLAVDVRVIAASNVDLARAVERRLFREDLYYRLNVVPLQLPALRERTEDIPMLVVHLLQKHAGLSAGRALSFTEGALRRLCAYPWPGNVRELENAVRRCVVLARHDVVGEAELLELVPVLRHGERDAAPAADGGDALVHVVAAIVAGLPEGAPLYDEVIRRVEVPLFALAMERTGQNQLRAAELLGINRNTLRKRLRAGAEPAPDAPDGDEEGDPGGADSP